MTDEQKILKMQKQIKELQNKNIDFLQLFTVIDRNIGKITQVLDRITRPKGE